MAAILAARKDQPPFEASVVRSDGGYVVTANGKTEEFTLGAYGEAGGAEHRSADVWKYQPGYLGFTPNGLQKLRALGLYSDAQGYPVAKSFVAAAAPAPQAEGQDQGPAERQSQPAPTFASSPDKQVATPSRAASEPDFLARARERYGLAAAPPPAANSFVDRMRARHAPPAEGSAADPIAAPQSSSNAEPSFLARMKQRHGVTE